MTEPAVSRPSGSLGTWIAVVAAVATAALGVSIAALVVALDFPDDAAPAAAPTGDIAGDSAGDAGSAGDAVVEAEAAPDAADPAAEQAVTVDPLTVVGVVVGAGGGALAELPASPTVRIDTFFDFMCPYCAQFEEAYAAQLQGLVDSGQIVWVQHPLAFLDRFSQGTNYSSRTAAAAYTVAGSAPEAFSAFVQALFASQPAENTTGLTDEQIIGIAQEAGVPETVTSEFWAATDYLDTQLAYANDAVNAGITGTPTLLISTPGTTPEKWDYETPLDQLVAAKAGQ
jgi:protein-disulfide isomerase